MAIQGQRGTAVFFPEKWTVCYPVLFHLCFVCFLSSGRIKMKLPFFYLVLGLASIIASFYVAPPPVDIYQQQTQHISLSQ